MQLLDQNIREYRENQLVNLACDVAQLSRPSTYAVHALRGRLIELNGEAYSSDLYRPGELAVEIEPFEVYRYAAKMQALRSVKEAERSYALALKAEPEFSVALRRYAEILRQRDPAQAASRYSEALNYAPRLHRSSQGIIGFHRNFLLTRHGKEYVAAPVAIGEIDISSPVTRWPSRRFYGLMLMRLRVHPRNKASVAASSAAVAMRPSSKIKARLERSLGRFSRSIDSCWRYCRPMLINWVMRKASLFQFVIVGSSMEDLKQQIDQVDKLWLSRTYSE